MSLNSRYSRALRRFTTLAIVAVPLCAMLAEGPTASGAPPATNPPRAPAKRARNIVAPAAPLIGVLFDDGREVQYESLDDIERADHVIRLDVFSGGFDDSEASVLGRFTRISELYVPGLPCDMRAINLREFTRLTDRGLESIARLRSLSALKVGSERITDRGVVAIAGLVGLRSLWLHAPKVTNAGVRRLANMRCLESLVLRTPKLTDAGVMALAPLPQLVELNVFGTAVTGVGFGSAWFRGNSGLRRLAADFTDEGLLSISKLRPDLQSMDIRGEHATDAGLVAIADLPHLKRLGLFETRCTDEGIEAFIRKGKRGRRVISGTEGLIEEFEQYLFKQESLIEAFTRQRRTQDGR